MVAPCNMNEKLFAEPLLEKLKGLGVNFKAVLADAQYNSSKDTNRATSHLKTALSVKLSLNL